MVIKINYMIKNYLNLSQKISLKKINNINKNILNLLSKLKLIIILILNNKSIIIKNNLVLG
jgi:hypothetical protein